MARCMVCGNEYDKASEAVMPGKDSHTFDSFERAIYALALTCEHCGCRLIGRCTEAHGRSFCWANCAREAGYSGIVDRA